MGSQASVQLSGRLSQPQDDSLGQRLAPLWAALLAMAPFLSILGGRSEFYFDDHFRFSTPLATLVGEALRDGHLPLWNPWAQTGVPLIAERGGMVCHPGMLLTLVLSPSHAIGVLMVLLLGVLAAGSTALLRALSVRTVLAIGIGAAIGLSGPALSYTSNAPFLATLAFWPLVLLSAVRLATGRGSVVGGGAALGMALLGGDLPGALLAALVAFFVFLAAGGRLRTTWPRLAGVLAIALVLGAGAWYPVVWALPLSERGAGIAASEAGRWSFHPGEIVGFLWPHPLGLPLPRFTLWPFRLAHYDRLFLHSVWIGALPAAASVLALRKRGPARAFAMVALVLVLLGTGESTPLWPVLRPLFTFVRYPSKLVAPAAILLALAGAVAIEDLLSRPRGMRNLCLVVAALTSLGALVGPAVQSALARWSGAPNEIVLAAAGALRSGTLRVALLAGVAAGLFLLVERGRVPTLRAVPFLATLIFVDVFVTTVDLAWTRPPATLTRPLYLPEANLRGPRVMRLEEVSHARLALNEVGFSEEQLRQAALLSPLVNLPLHVSLLDPYGFYLADVAQAMADLATLAPTALAEVTATDVVLAAPTSVAPWLAQAVDSRRLRPTHSIAAGALALRVQHPLPRSFLIGAASLGPCAEIPKRLAKSSDRLQVTSEKALKSGRFVALDPSQLPAELLGAPSSPPVALPPTTWRPGAATYQTDLAVPSLLVEMEAFMPGWQVFVDGQERPILQADVFGRAVVVPAGSHTVAWTFEPPSLIASMMASWVGLVLALLVLLVPKNVRYHFLRSPGGTR